ncbi:hypothetical protein [Roseibium sediminis]|uniref:hypothetical protein n=1 Tax=Roseibium sediminis TaxID=1775174 RepID=UPI001375D1AF|nr:hypothetical protein [Roseibium sediminis]
MTKIAVIEVESASQPTIIEVSTAGVQGPKGEAGTIVAVSETPPENAEEGTLWIDIS